MGTPGSFQLADFKAFASLIPRALSYRQSDQCRQVNLSGITRLVRFDEDGKRTKVDLEILNLRNNSFKKVSSCRIFVSRLFSKIQYQFSCGRSRSLVYKAFFSSWFSTSFPNQV